MLDVAVELSEFCQFHYVIAQMFFLLNDLEIALCLSFLYLLVDLLLIILLIAVLFVLELVTILE